MTPTYADGIVHAAGLKGRPLPKMALDAACVVLEAHVAEAYEPEWRELIQDMFDAIVGQITGRDPPPEEPWEGAHG